MVNTATPLSVLGLLLGGMLLLLYGVRLVTEAMQRATGMRVRRAMTLLARFPAAAFGVGALATLLTQSSGATSALLVGLVSTQLVPMTAAIVMLLGANVGSTLVVQLLALHITDYAVVLVGLGAAAAMVTRRGAQRDTGQALFGFGLVLLGLATLQAGSTPIAASPATADVLEALARAPLVLMLVGAVLAMIFTSSAATIGLVLVLAANGTLSLLPALAIVLGANVGSTIMALWTTLSSDSIVGKRLALIHTGTKLIGALAALLALGPLTAWLLNLHIGAGEQVTVAHFVFNVVLAIVFVPLAALLARVSTLLLPEPSIVSTVSGARYLDPEALSMPAVALGQAIREILRMTDLVTEMLQLSIHAFEHNGAAIPQHIDALDDQLDELEAAVKRYLTQLDENLLTGEQVRREIELLYIITDLEAIGDIIDKQFMRLARRKRRDGVEFSEEGWHDLVTYHGEIMAALQQTLAALAAQDPASAAEVLERKVRLSRDKREFHLRHLRRLRAGVSPSLESSAIHLDFLNAMSRVVSHTSNIAHAVHGDV